MRGWYSIAVLLVYFVLSPFVIAWIREDKPNWLCGIRKFALILIGCAISYGFTIAVIWVPYGLGWWTFRGPEMAFALFLGWLYMPITALPALGLYSAVRKRTRRIPFFLALAAIVFAGLWLLHGRGDAVEQTFSWVLKTEGCACAEVGVEEDVIREYKVTPQFAQRMLKLDPRQYGFTPWDKISSAICVGGYKHDAVFSNRDEMLYVSKKIGRFGNDEAVIYLDVKECRMALYCPTY